MSRYSMNVNYAPSPWEKADQGIGAAIGMYQQRQDQQRQEENQIAAQGGTPVGPAPATIGSRVGQVGNFIRRRILGQTDGPPQVQGAEGGQQNAPLAPGVDGSNVALQVPAVAGVAGIGGGETPADGGSPLPMPSRSIGDMLAPAASAASSTPVVRSGPGYQPQPPMASVAPPAGSIGAALSPYTVRAGSGQQYSIDPNRAANAQRAQKRGELQDEIDVKGADRDKTQADQIQALIDSGMSPAVARAKVLNNVVKYDETFGQQHPGVMNQKDRLAVQDRIDQRQKQAQQAALRLEQMRQQGRQGTREFQQLSVSLRAQQQDDANDRALLAADESAARNAEAGVTKLQTNPVVSNTPEGQKQITAAQAEAEAARQRANESRDRIASKGSRRPGASGQKPVAQRDAELKAQGLKADQRRAKLKAEGYDVQ